MAHPSTSPSPQAKPRSKTREVYLDEGPKQTQFFLIKYNTRIMADLKRRTLQLSSGKQIKLFGNSVAISKTLEIGEGYAPNILSLIEDQSEVKTSGGLSNPHKLTVDDLMEL